MSPFFPVSSFTRTQNLDASFLLTDGSELRVVPPGDRPPPRGVPPAENTQGEGQSQIPVFECARTTPSIWLEAKGLWQPFGDEGDR